MVSASTETDGVPHAVPIGDDILPLFGEGDLPHISVIRQQAKTADMLQISKNASLPTWLKPRMYTKLDTELNYDLEKLPNKELGWLMKSY